QRSDADDFRLLHADARQQPRSRRGERRFQPALPDPRAPNDPNLPENTDFDAGRPQRARQRVVGWAFLLVLLAPLSPAFALNPSLQVSQYAHTAWNIRDGAFQATIRAIAQTADGYLWFANEFGLLRFDGIRFVEWTPPAGQALPSTDIWSVLAG